MPRATPRITPRTTRLTSLNNPRLKAVVKLREARERRRTGLFIAEGRREVSRAAAAGLAIREVYFCPPLLGEDEPGDPAGLARRYGLSGEGRGDGPRPAEARWFEVTAALLGKIAYRREPEGLLAVVDQPGWSLDSLPPAGGASGFYLVAVGTQKPGNLGAMVRTADAAGCDGVIAAGAAVDAMNPNAIRASTGAVFSLPTVSVPEDEALDWLGRRGLRLAAAVARGGISPHRFDFTGPLAIVIGPEDRGLDRAWVQAASANGGGPVTLAMRGRVADSLNASIAGAVLLFEALRQRGEP